MCVSVSEREREKYVFLTEKDFLVSSVSLIEASAWTFFLFFCTVLPFGTIFLGSLLC